MRTLTFTRFRPALALVMLAAGCATVGETPGPPPPGVFTADARMPPMGTKWTVKETSYNENTGKTQADSITWTVMGEGAHEGKPVYHLWDGANVHVHDRSTRSWIAVLDKDSQEILADYPHDGQFSSPLWVGKSWVARFTRHERIRKRTFYDVVFVWKVTAYEEVQVPAGTFKAFRVEAWPDERDPVKKRIYWYAPDVRLVVKEVTEGFGAPYKIGLGRDRMRHTLELVEYSVAEGPSSGRAASFARPVLAGPTTVPVEIVANLTLVVAVLNRSQQSLLLVDTGATRTAITPAQLKRLGLSIPPNAPRRQVSVVGGQKVDVPFVTLPAIQVGEATIEHFEVGVVDVVPEAPQIGGLLGGDFLQRFKLTLDRTQRSMRLEPLPDTLPATLSGDAPALVEMLEKHPDPSRRVAAAQALARMPAGSPEVKAVIPALRGALRDPAAEVRTSAAQALGAMAASVAEAVSALVESARDDEPEVRVAAVRLLGMVGAAARAANPVLLDALRNDPNSTGRAAAATALGRIGPTDGQTSAFVYALADSLRESDPLVREAAASALTPLAEALVPVLDQDLRARDAGVRRKAAETLRWIGPFAPTLAVVVFVRALGDGDGRVRSTSVLGLADAGMHQSAISFTVRTVLQTALQTTPGAAAALAELVRHEEPEVRVAAIWLLGRVGAAARGASPGASSLLLAALRNDTNGRVRGAAAAALREIGPTASEIPALVDALRDADPFVREQATYSLMPRAAELVPVLEQNLRAGDAEVRWKAVDTLRWIGPAAPALVMPILGRALEDDDPRVRSTSARGLGATGEAALPVLRAALRHRDPGVRAAAAEAISDLGFRAVDALTSLVDALKDADVSVRLSVVRALRVIGSEAQAAVGALRTVAESDPSPELRALAEVAIHDIVGR